MITRRKSLLGLAGVALSGNLFAQQWPTKPIRIIVPYPPGGANDVSARVYGPYLSQSLGQTVVIDNRAGAGGQIGAATVAGSAPDGYTLLFGAIGSLTIQAVVPALKPPYDLMAAFTGVSMGTGVQLAVAVRADLPATTINSLVSAAKVSSRGLTYGSAGNGSTQHMTGEYFQQAAGIKLVHVPYKGSSPAIVDLLGGQIDMVFETLPALASQLSSGKIRILAVTGDTRSELLPTTPTLKESGYPDFGVTTYYGLLAPQGTPLAVVDRLSKAMQGIAQLPEVQSTLKKQGAEAYATSVDATNALIKSEVERWARVQKVAQVK